MGQHQRWIARTVDELLDVVAAAERLGLRIATVIEPTKEETHAR